MERDSTWFNPMSSCLMICTSTAYTSIVFLGCIHIVVVEMCPPTTVEMCAPMVLPPSPKNTPIWKAHLIHKSLLTVPLRELEAITLETRWQTLGTQALLSKIPCISKATFWISVMQYKWKILFKRT